MRYPLVLDLAADKIPVAVTCRVLGFSGPTFYQWAPTSTGRQQPPKLSQSQAAHPTSPVQGSTPQPGGPVAPFATTSSTVVASPSPRRSRVDDGPARPASRALRVPPGPASGRLLTRTTPRLQMASIGSRGKNGRSAKIANTDLQSSAALDLRKGLAEQGTLVSHLALYLLQGAVEQLAA